MSTSLETLGRGRTQGIRWAREVPHCAWQLPRGIKSAQRQASSIRGKRKKDVQESKEKAWRKRMTNARPTITRKTGGPWHQRCVCARKKKKSRRKKKKSEDLGAGVICFFLLEGKGPSFSFPGEAVGTKKSEALPKNLNPRALLKDQSQLQKRKTKHSQKKELGERGEVTACLFAGRYSPYSRPRTPPGEGWKFA